MSAPSRLLHKHGRYLHSVELMAGEAPDLMLTDVVMPCMSGRELGDRILAERPQVKVLYMSAHADDVLEPHGVLNAGATLLRKPFLPAVLSQKVSERLRSNGPARPI